MGANTSKNTDSNRLNILLDPRSPDVNRTPLTGIVRNSRIATLTPSTPKTSSIENTSFEKRKFDPRSPSKFIPRTPLNMSFDNIEHSAAAQYSLEYSGCVEEASCRNFNERLENITFDNLFAETKVPEEEQSTEKVDDEPKEQIAMSVYTDVEEESASPYIQPMTLRNTRQNQFAFSSTPISALNSNIELHAKKLKEYGTPTKKMANIKEIRTPFGSLLNRRTKSFENLQHQLPLKVINDTNDENSTPKIKKNITKTSGIRMKNQIFCD